GGATSPTVRANGRTKEGRMARSTRGAAWRLLIGICLLGLVLVTAAAGEASSISPRARTVTGRSAERELISAGEADQQGDEAHDEVLALARQYAGIRTLPARSVSARAMLQARLQAAGLETSGGAWSELTNQPYNSDARGYRDPIFSNSGGGWARGRTDPGPRGRREHG